MSSPEWRIERAGSRETILTLSGDWCFSYAHHPPVLNLVSGVCREWNSGALILRGQNLGLWDALLIAQIYELTTRGRAFEGGLVLDGMPPGVGALWQLATQVAVAQDHRRTPLKRGRLQDLGLFVQHLFEDFLFLNRFVGDAALSFSRLVMGRARYRPVDLWLQIQDCGPSAVPIVTLISLLVGLILAFVGAVQLALFGAQLYIADLVALGMTREMGALMTAIIMAGRSGASFAAQIGTMNVNMEIPALRVMGFSALDFLVMPRLLALSLVMPFLGLYSDLLGIFGGALVAVTFFDIPFSQFLTRTAASVDLYDFFIGVFKCALFGVLIAVSGCMRGLQCGRTASAVGDAATSAVVTGIVMIVIADSIVTLVCNRLGI